VSHRTQTKTPAAQPDQPAVKPPAATVVAVGPELTLASVGPIKEALGQALAGGGAVVIDASGLAEVDFAGLQLLCAAHRGAARRGCGLRVTGAAGAAGASVPSIARAISELGFGRDAACVDGCLCKEATRG